MTGRSADSYYSQEEMDLIKNGISKKLAYGDIARIIHETLGIFRTRNGIRKHVERHRKFYDNSVSSYNSDSFINSRGVVDNESTNITSLIKLTKVSEYISTLNEIAKLTPSVKKIKPISSSKESLVLLLSDLHIGKRIVDCKGNVIYDTNIALSYIKKLNNQLLHVMEHAGKGTKIDEIVVLILGDIVDNEIIYSSQIHHIDSCVSQQVNSATKAVWELLRSLGTIEGIKSVRAVCVRGNHGVPSRDASSEDSNWDNVIYNNLEYISQLTDTNISIETNYAEYNIAEVKGHKILLRHNIPLTADTAAARAKLGGWFDLHQCQTIVGGHYHHPAIQTWNDKYVFRNGCLSGADDLSERMAVYSTPAQIVFGVSEKRLPTFMYVLSFDT